MDIITFIVAWIMAVMAMTLFSTLWSMAAQHQFREHILLSQIHGNTDASLKKFNFLVGCLVHFIMGAVFLALYELLWIVTGLPRTIEWALAFGSMLGLLGILGWTIMFKVFSKPPHLDMTHFFVHLFFAHWVFSLVALGVYVLT